MLCSKGASGTYSMKVLRYMCLGGGGGGGSFTVTHRGAKSGNRQYPLSIRAYCEHDNLENKHNTDVRSGV